MIAIRPQVRQIKQPGSRLSRSPAPVAFAVSDFREDYSDNPEPDHHPAYLSKHVNILFSTYSFQRDVAILADVRTVAGAGTVSSLRR